MRNHIFQHYKFSILLKIMFCRFCLRYQKKWRRRRRQRQGEGAMITAKYLGKHFRVKPQQVFHLNGEICFRYFPRLPPNDTNHKYIMMISLSPPLSAWDFVSQWEGRGFEDAL
jgi:hypothetical protein